jgi:hypothetical protein
MSSEIRAPTFAPRLHTPHTTIHRDQDPDRPTRAQTNKSTAPFVVAEARYDLLVVGVQHFAPVAPAADPLYIKTQPMMLFERGARTAVRCCKRRRACNERRPVRATS